MPKSPRTATTEPMVTKTTSAMLKDGQSFVMEVDKFQPVTIETRPERVQAAAIALGDLAELLRNTENCSPRLMIAGLRDAHGRVVHIRGLLGL